MENIYLFSGPGHGKIVEVDYEFIAERKTYTYWHIPEDYRSVEDPCKYDPEKFIYEGRDLALVWVWRLAEGVPDIGEVQERLECGVPVVERNYNRSRMREEARTA